MSQRHASLMTGSRLSAAIDMQPDGGEPSACDPTAAITASLARQSLEPQVAFQLSRRPARQEAERVEIR